MRRDDFYELEALISDKDRERLKRVREFMHNEVATIINHYRRREEFPHEIVRLDGERTPTPWLDGDPSALGWSRPARLASSSVNVTVGSSFSPWR
jgi:hypothetical protein